MLLLTECCDAKLEPPTQASKNTGILSVITVESALGGNSTHQDFIYTACFMKKVHSFDFSARVYCTVLVCK